MAVVSGAERREFSRLALEARAELRVAGASLRCRLGDISLQGALVCAPASSLPASPGQACMLTVHLDAGSSRIQMKGVVAHVASGKIGIACQETDLDSLQHLRRLLELHLAEDKLVESELAALVRLHRR